MEFNELESPEMIRQAIQASVLFKIQRQIQSIYKNEVFVGYTKMYYIIHPCLYTKETILENILFIRHKKIKKKLLMEAAVYESSKIKVWVLDSAIYPIVSSEFEKFGKEHEKSITRIDIVKNFENYHSGCIK